MSFRSTVVPAGVLAISLGLLWACGGGGGGKRSGTTAIAEDPILCGQNINGSLGKTAGSPPVLSDGFSSHHFQIQTISPTAGSVVITLTSVSGDSNLHLAIPGTALGTTTIGNYYFSSADPGPSDSITISPLGVEDITGNLDSTYTLGDFLAVPEGPVFVVAAAVSPTDFTVVVSCPPPPNQPPVLDPITTPRNAPEGFPHAFTVTATDPELDPITLTATGLPTGAMFTDNGNGTGDFTFTPTLGQVGMLFTITFGADDGINPAVTQDVDINVVPRNRPPTLDPIPTPQTVAPFNTLAFTVTATDPDLDPITLMATPSITNASFVDNGNGTGDFSFTPDSSQVGMSYIVTFSAEDGINLPVTQDVTIDVLGNQPTTLVSCGSLVSSTVPGSSSPSLPDFTNLAETIFYEMPPLATGTVQVIIDLAIITGDAHLLLAAPGTVPGSVNPADYAFCSCETGDDRITMDLTSITDIVGSPSGFTLADYLAAATPISFLVAGYSPATDYDLTVSCCPMVQDISCGTTIRGISIEGPGSGGPFLDDCKQSHYYRITGVTPGVEAVTILSWTVFNSGDTDIYLLDVGIQAGSTSLADYAYNSIPGMPFSTNLEDSIAVMPAGISTFLKSANMPTLTQYLGSGVEMGFVVTGRDLLSVYDLTIHCDSTPLQVPVLIACGGSVSGSLIGNQLSPPDYTNPNEVTFYEIDGTTIPAGVTSIDISVMTTNGDTDFYLAAPGVTPGIPAMILESIQPMIFPDGATIDATGITGFLGPNGQRITADWNLNDYLGASTNISFVVQSWALASDYTLTVTCN